jgi:hypothetical protein
LNEEVVKSAREKREERRGERSDGSGEVWRA